MESLSRTCLPMCPTELLGIGAAKCCDGMTDYKARKHFVGKIFALNSLDSVSQLTRIFEAVG